MRWDTKPDKRIRRTFLRPEPTRRTSSYAAVSSPTIPLTGARECADAAGAVLDKLACDLLVARRRGTPPLLSQPINASLELRRSTVALLPSIPPRATSPAHTPLALSVCLSCAFSCFCGDARQQRADADVSTSGTCLRCGTVGRRREADHGSGAHIGAVARLRRTPRGRFGCDRVREVIREVVQAKEHDLSECQTRDRFAGRLSKSDPVSRHAGVGQVGPSVEPHPPGAAEARRTDSDGGSQEVSMATLVTAGWRLRVATPRQRHASYEAPQFRPDVCASPRWRHNHFMERPAPDGPT